MDHSDSPIIDRLGGNSVLADVFGISSQAVSKWRKEGIPPARRMYLKVVSPAAFVGGDNPALNATGNVEKKPDQAPVDCCLGDPRHDGRRWPDSREGEVA